MDTINTRLTSQMLLEVQGLGLKSNLRKQKDRKRSLDPWRLQCLIPPVLAALYQVIFTTYPIILSVPKQKVPKRKRSLPSNLILPFSP